MKYQALFNHLSNEHDLILTQSEMEEIMRIVFYEMLGDLYVDIKSKDDG